MYATGLYINDYSISDCNRDMIMATVQQSDDLKNLLKNEREKSQILAKNLRELDHAKNETIELLSQMMPKHVANQLIALPENSIPNIVETFDDASVCFLKVYEFQKFAESLSPTNIVSMLNDVFSLLDAIVEKHGIYKVETIGESYMVSCGCPHPTRYNAEYIADAALDMLTTLATYIEPSTKVKVRIKLGTHSGQVVGGIVGLKAPRFCLFGDTVNCASRMESHNSKPNTAMASVFTKRKLDDCAATLFTFTSRGTIDVKGKGLMEAFEIVTKHGEPRCEHDPLQALAEEDLEERAVYTPPDEAMSVVGGSRMSSAMSRMSVSSRVLQNASRNTSSRISGISGPDAAEYEAMAEGSDECHHVNLGMTHLNVKHIDEATRKKLATVQLYDADEDDEKDAIVPADEVNKGALSAFDALSRPKQQEAAKEEETTPIEEKKETGGLAPSGGLGAPSGGLGAGIGAGKEKAGEGRPPVAGTPPPAGKLQTTGLGAKAETNNMTPVDEKKKSPEKDVKKTQQKNHMKTPAQDSEKVSADDIMKATAPPKSGSMERSESMDSEDLEAHGVNLRSPRRGAEPQPSESILHNGTGRESKTDESPKPQTPNHSSSVVEPLQLTPVEPSQHSLHHSVVNESIQEEPRPHAPQKEETEYIREVMIENETIIGEEYSDDGQRAFSAASTAVSEIATGPVQKVDIESWVKESTPPHDEIITKSGDNILRQKVVDIRKLDKVLSEQERPKVLLVHKKCMCGMQGSSKSDACIIL